MNNKIVDENVDLFKCPDTGEDMIYVRQGDQQSHFVNKFETKFHATKGFLDFVGYNSAKKVTARSRSKQKDFTDHYNDFLTGKDWYHKIINKLMFSQELDIRKMMSVAKVFLTTLQDALILDIPCGTGVLSQPLYFDFPKFKFMAADYSVSMLTKAYSLFEAKNIDNSILMQAKPEKLPFKDSIFDGVISLNGINQFENYKVALSEIRRVMKPGTKMVGICYVNGQNKLGDKLTGKLLVEKEIFKSVFTREELEQAFDDAGFEGVTFNIFNSYPLVSISANNPKGK